MRVFLFYVFWGLIVLIVGCVVADYLMPFLNRMFNRSRTNSLVDFIIETGTTHTRSGNYHIYYEDILKEFPSIPEDWLRRHHNDILHEIDSREEILSETWTDSDQNGNPIGFDCNFCLSWCSNYDENIWVL